MRRIISVETTTEACGETVQLEFDQRNRRRMVFTTTAGNTILLDMVRAIHLRDGDRLRLEDGSLVLVEALGEELLEIRAHSSAELVRIAWHLGNRHLPTQLLAGGNGGTLRIRHDHVIAAMVEGLGGHCYPVLAPFDPEGGAYEGDQGHHGHGHDHAPGHHHHAHG